MKTMTHRSPGRLLYRWLAPFVLLASLATASTAQDASPPKPGSRPFGDSIGLVVKFAQGQPMSDLPSLTELKVRWVRDLVRWAEIEPQPGKFADFSPALKKRLEFYRKNDIGLVALLWFANEKAYPPTAAEPARSYDPVSFGRFAARVASMLREAGVKFVLEVGNEPHNSSLPKLLGGAWNGKAPSPWVDHYVRMVNEAVQQVKALDPSVKVLSDDDMWVVHYWFLQAGLPATLDGFAVHPYAETPERAAVAHDTDWTRPFVVVDRDRSFASAVRRLREAGYAKLGKSPEIWVTEWGWPVAADVFPKFVSEEVLAGYLPRSFIVGVAAGVEVVCWFSSQDTVDGPMGLTNNQGHRRKSYQAFKVMSEQLGSYHLVRQVPGTPNAQTGIQAYLFKGERNQKLALWSTDGQPRHITLRADAAVDALGHEIPAKSGETSQMSIGPMPVYITGSWTDESINNAITDIK
ncbi:hypothetical protein [Methylibium sp.]|uniref:hypothetical protein n=1 Tax=Methylibium sp. TaxID=2067992 RepID=UPI003D11277C